ncbi:NUDIX hydrolase [Candidatus Woesebacteria bacterium]|nr:NUDIX hydrolase [Candidatus Woesebacteria bacterium]
MEIEIHEYQISILRELLFKPNARFRDLKKVNIENDLFSFHLRQLLKYSLIEKKDGKYSLTTKGKEFANRMDTDKLKLERQAKVAVALHPVRKRNGELQHLVHKRLKEPFYGWCGSQSGKIRWGETPLQAAKREMKEETGLTGRFTLKAIIHYHHIHKDGRFLEDKYFWVYKVNSLKGKLKKKVEEGENIWMTESEYRKLKNVFATVDEVLEEFESPTLQYIDKIKIVDEY